MAKPIIAITGPQKGARVPRWLVAFAIKLYGGTPLQLYPDDASKKPYFDGVVITGGHDVEPVLYAAEPEVEANYDAARDAFEIKMIEQALAQNRPILGICRGAQLLNICYGGRLLQQLKNKRHKTSHRWTILPLKTLCLEPPGLIPTLFAGQKTKINSLHNQAIDQLGNGLVITSRDLDHLIQSIEDPAKPFVIGTQWHPEFLLYQKPQRQLFQQLIQQASKQRNLE